MFTVHADQLEFFGRAQADINASDINLPAGEWPGAIRIEGLDDPFIVLMSDVIRINNEFGGIVYTSKIVSFTLRVYND